MRLLYRDNGRLALTPDLQNAHEPYAILSHTWLADEDEVQFQDLQKPECYENKLGYKKLEFLLNQAAKDNLRYVWADTCCIDKNKGPELDEALNRMFEWYTNSKVCYVYLYDVPQVPFERSRWFTRGWTLQELVAPRHVQFFDHNGNLLGDAASLATAINVASGIDKPLDESSLADRFRWSLRRQTKKPEDISYCLIGLMKVSMRANYGEAGKTAQQRLLRKIEKKHGEAIAEEIRHLIPATNPVKEDFKPELTIAALQRTLHFDQMFTRRQIIRDPYAKTCEWILQHQSYYRWLVNGPFLWIKGKPGAGKSTIMKYIEGKDDRAKISFFFNARGTSLESSTLGMYRSLLHEMLERFPETRKTTLRYIQEQHIDVSRGWTTNLLQDVLKHSIMSLIQPVRIYIDALDEGSDEEVRDMVEFIHDLAQVCKHFTVCFTSRYYPGISIKDCTELRLEDQSEHDRDLADFVHGRLNASLALQSKVIEKANGVFFWAVIVVRLLNQDIDSGEVINLEQRLEKIPPGISALLENIARNTDEKLLLAMQWISCALRPLKLEEFYFAMMAGLSEFDDAYARPWDPERLGEDDMGKFLYNCSRGLAEHVGDRYEYVQFIHESVRDWLLVNRGLQAFGDVASTHDRLKQICFKHARRFLDDQLEGYTSPFMRYAKQWMMFHAEEAAATVCQERFLLELDESGIVDDGFMLFYSHTDLTPCTSRMLYVLAQFDLPNLVHTACKAGFSLSGPNLTGCTPLMEAYMTSSIRAFEALLECGADPTIGNWKGKTLLEMIHIHRNGLRVDADNNQYLTLLAKYGAVIRNE